MSLSKRLALVLGLFVVAGCCKKKSGDSGGPSLPVGGVAMSDGGSCEGQKARLWYAGNDGSINGSDLPGAARLGDQQLAVKEGRVSEPVDWAKAAAGTPLAAWTRRDGEKEGKRGLFGDVELGMGRSCQGILSISSEGMGIGLANGFEKALKGPFAVSKEGSGAAVVWIPSRNQRRTVPVLFGNAETFGDVATVVLTTDLPAKEKSCGSFRNARSGATATYSISRYDLELVFVERKTGKVKEKKRLAAPDKACPKTITGGGSEGSEVPMDDVLAAVRGK